MSFLNISNLTKIVARTVDNIKSALNLSFEIWRNQSHCSSRTFNMTKEIWVVFQRLSTGSYNSKKSKLYLESLWQSPHATTASLGKSSSTLRCLSAKWQIGQIKALHNKNDLDAKMVRTMIDQDESSATSSRERARETWTDRTLSEASLLFLPPPLSRIVDTECEKIWVAQRRGHKF